MSEEELWDTMMDGKCAGTFPFPQALATIAAPITLRKWQGHGATPEYQEVVLPAGSRVRVVMASRFGDVGITDDLNATSGYHYRTTCIRSEFAGQVCEPKNLLRDIELIHRDRPSPA